MSKLNRKEFKELLIEWNQNFISERYQSQITKDAFQNIHSLNTREEQFPELNVDLIEYDRFDGMNEFSPELQNMIVDFAMKESVEVLEDGVGCSIGFPKLKYKEVCKKIIEDLINNNQLQNKSYEDILNNNNSLIITVSAVDNDGIDIKRGISKKDDFNNSIWMLHDIYHNLAQWPEEYNDIIDYESFISLYCHENNKFTSWSKNDLLTDYINDYLTHSNIDDHVVRNTDSDDIYYDMCVFITYFCLDIENGQINIENSKNKLKTRLENDFRNHHVLSKYNNLEESDDEFILSIMDNLKRKGIDNRKDLLINLMLLTQEKIIKELNKLINHDGDPKVKLITQSDFITENLI